MKVGYRQKWCMSLVAVVLLLFGNASAMAREYDTLDTLIAECIPNVEKADSLHELYGLSTVPISPDEFVQSVMNDEEYIEQIWGNSGDFLCELRGLFTDEIKRFTFTDVPINSELSDVVVIRYGHDPSFICFVFTSVCGEWNLIDVLPGVYSVDIVCGITNSWLIARTYAFQYTVETENVYNLINRTYETYFISHAANSVYDTDILVEGTIYLSGHVKVDEFSIVEDDESVYHCYLYIARDAGVCSLEDGKITEYAADTSIDIYEYDYESCNLVYMQTNHYKDISRATIDCILQWESLLPNTPIIRK